MGTPFRSYLCFRESISSPLPFGPSSNPGLLGQKTGFLCRGWGKELRNTTVHTGPQWTMAAAFKMTKGKQILGGGVWDCYSTVILSSLKQWGTRCWVTSDFAFHAPEIKSSFLNTVWPRAGFFLCPHVCVFSTSGQLQRYLWWLQEMMYVKHSSCLTQK